VQLKEIASVEMYKHFIRALLINAAAPCRYVQTGADLEINKPSTQNLKKL
jgi:hypothetical protein